MRSGRSCAHANLQDVLNNGHSETQSNGRKKPKMPAVKDKLTKEQVWAVVAYVQTLRKPATP